MKKHLHKKITTNRRSIRSLFMQPLLAVLLLNFMSESSAQTTSTFESLPLSANSYWDGSDKSGGFSNGDAYFFNTYTTYSTGFNYSNKKDVTTAGYTNSYSAFAGEGYNGSANYVVGYGTPSMKLTGAAQGSVVRGFYVTNTTYAALSMKEGDQFSKKFGGATGNDPDWFKLTVTGFLHGDPKPTEVDFYLADFRFNDNRKDYILNTWEWVNLTSLGEVDSLSFSLSSSDVGQWGMNTPAYFAMDNFNEVTPLAVRNAASSSFFSLFPNPASDKLTLSFESALDDEVLVKILDAQGHEVFTSQYHQDGMPLAIGDLAKGIYIILVQQGDSISCQQFVKQ